MLSFELSGFGAASDSVRELQTALKNLAVAANFPSGDPGSVDGVVGQLTVSAIASWSSQIPKLPGPVASVLKVAGAAWPLLPAATQKTVTDTITQYAHDIAIGVRALTALYTGTVAPPGPPASMPTGNMALIVQAGPLQPPSSAGGGGGRYKAGSISRFNTSRQVWSVYSPLAGAGFGVFAGGGCMFGDCDLGDAVDPPVPAGFTKVAEEAGAQLPAGTTSAGTEKDKKSFFMNPITWLVGGALAIGGGAYWWHTRKAA